jgi:type II secretory pathway component GspD/PulD (secretin)
MTPNPADTNMLAEPMPTNGLVLNFQNVPLSAVLNYLSAKAGLVIVSDVSLQGRVSVVAKQPITTNEIVTLLNDQLGKNNYAALLQGRTLSIMDADRAKTYALTPVEVTTSYTNMAINDEIVTAILPLHTLPAGQLVKDLDQLIPKGATVTANEGGNAIIMTAQRKDVRRIAEIIGGLDGTALSEVEVSVLSYADAKSVASELKEVFQSQDSDITRASTRNQGRGGFRGFGGGGGFPFGGGGGGSTDNPDKNVQTHAVFVSDDQMNAVISAAPPDYMRMITNVIALLDKPSQDITVMRVFRLQHADPMEIADELTQMFPSTTSTDQSSQRTMGFRFLPPWMQQQNPGSSLSPRMKREQTVTVVADRRIQAVTVSASKDTMEQIAGVIKDLDEGNEGNQMVKVMDIGAADPATVENYLAGLFGSTSRPTTSSSQSQTALSARGQANNNSQATAVQSATTGSSSGGMGSSGLR